MGIFGIIALAAASVLAFTAFLVAKAHCRGRGVSREKDFITAYDEKVGRDIEESGAGMGKKAYYAILACAPAAIGLAVFRFTGSPAGAAVCGAFGLFIPSGILRITRIVRESGFEKRFLRALEQLDSSLRSGSSIAQAVDDVANCRFVHESLRKSFATLSTDIHMGVGVSQAFRRFAERTGSRDAEDVALALEIQDEIGGHEADAVRNISDNIKNRIMTRKEVKSAFAGESSLVWIADFMIPGIMIAFTAMNPSYASVYFDSPGYTLLYIGFFAMCLAGSAINHRALRRVQQ